MIIHPAPPFEEILEAFERYIEQPSNRDKRFELVDGEIIEVPSNPYSSQLALRITYYIIAFLMNHPIGHVTGEGAGYRVRNTILSPDGAYISKARQPELVREGFNPIPPELAIEVISPTDRQTAIRRKLAIYADANVLVWLVYPTRQIVEVYAPDQPVEIFDIHATLTAPDLLPGFSLPVRAIFQEQ